jgi:hypothetical protein
MLRSTGAIIDSYLGNTNLNSPTLYNDHTDISDTDHAEPASSFTPYPPNADNLDAADVMDADAF